MMRQPVVHAFLTLGAFDILADTAGNNKPQHQRPCRQRNHVFHKVRHRSRHVIDLEHRQHHQRNDQRHDHQNIKNIQPQFEEVGMQPGGRHLGNFFVPLFRPGGGRIEALVAAHFVPDPVTPDADDHVDQAAGGGPGEVEAVAEVAGEEIADNIQVHPEQQPGCDGTQTADDPLGRAELPVPGMGENTHQHRQRTCRLQCTHECIEEAGRQRQPEEVYPRNINEDPDPVHTRTHNGKDTDINVHTQRVPFIHKTCGKQHRQHGNQTVNGMIMPDLDKAHIFFQIEEGGKCPGCTGHGHDTGIDKGEPVEGVAERFGEIGFDIVDPADFLHAGFFHRGIFAFFDHQTHGADAHQIEDGGDQEDFLHVSRRILECEPVIQRTGGRTDYAEETGKFPQMFRRHHVVEEAVEHRVHKEVEELEHDHENTNGRNGHRGGSPTLQKRNHIPQKVGNFFAPAQQKQVDAEEGQRGKNKGNTASPPAPAAVTLDADVRCNGHGKNVGNRRHDHTHDPVGAVQTFQFQRDQAGYHCFHDSVAEVTPEQPPEEGDQPQFGVFKCSALARFCRVCVRHDVVPFM